MRIVFVIVYLSESTRRHFYNQWPNNHARYTIEFDVYNTYTLCTEYVHNIYTICTQYVHNMYTICIHNVYTYIVIYEIMIYLMAIYFKIVS